MVDKSIFTYPTLLGYLLKRMEKSYPDKQIGKTIVQKMMYLLTREGIVDFNYSMYHYGPYSSEVSGELDFANSTGIIDINWIDDKGYFINSTQKLENFETRLTEKNKQVVDKFVKKFGRFNAIELSLIATAFFLKDNFNIPNERIAEVVHNAKPKYSLEFIDSVLQNSGIM